MLQEDSQKNNITTKIEHKQEMMKRKWVKI